MKKVKMIVEMIVTDEYFNEGFKDIQKEVSSGKYQRDIKEGQDGIISIKMSAEEIK